MHPVQPTKKKVHVLQDDGCTDPLVVDWRPPRTLVGLSYGPVHEPRIEVEAQRYMRSPLRDRVTFAEWLMVKFGDRRDEEGLR
jgi:hypothetical protein